MKQKSAQVMNTAAELLAERRKLEGWLAALHQRRSTTPEHVFTRVRADYEKRLDDILTELKSKADALDARVTELAERAGSLEADAEAAADARAEAELRAHVGELDAGAWEESSKASEARLEALERERGTVQEELASIRDLVGAARAPTPAHSSAGIESTSPARAEDEPSSNDATGSPEDAAGGDAAIVSDDGASHARPASGPGFDELAFLRNVTGHAAGEGEAAAPADAPPPPDAADSAPPAQAASRSGNERPINERPINERPINDSLGLVLPDATPAYQAPHRQTTEVPLAANVGSNSPIVIQSEGKQTKTLKCTDCGSMNYPTEWYCERCGAELSAL